MASQDIEKVVIPILPEGEGTIHLVTTKSLRTALILDPAKLFKRDYLIAN